jgi:hypothetical protein
MPSERARGSATSRGEQPFVRRMGTSERVLDYIYRLGIFVVAQVVRLNGPLTERDLVNALAALQNRHPLLRVHLPNARSDFVESGTEPIELRPVLRESADHWQRAYAEQIHAPQPYGRRPLVRVTWLRDAAGQEHELITSGSHIVLDGAAGTAYYRDLLSACARSIEGASAFGETLETVPALDELLPRWARERKKVQRFDPARIMSIDRAARPAKRCSRVQFRAVDADRTAQLVERARAHGVTLTSVLNAAALKAARSVEADDCELTVSTNVSLRHILEPPVAADHLGSYVSAVSTHHRVEQASDFWALARENADAVTRAVDAGEHLDAYRAKFGRLEKFVLRFFAPRFRAGRIQALNVTNMGRVPYPTQFGPLRATGFYIGSSQHILGSSMQVGAQTLGGTLCVTFVYSPPILAPARAAAFIDAFERELGGAMGDAIHPRQDAPPPLVAPSSGAAR